MELFWHLAGGGAAPRDGRRYTPPLWEAGELETWNLGNWELQTKHVNVALGNENWETEIRELGNGKLEM